MFLYVELLFSVVTVDIYHSHMQKYPMGEFLQPVCLNTCIFTVTTLHGSLSFTFHLIHIHIDVRQTISLAVDWKRSVLVSNNSAVMCRLTIKSLNKVVYFYNGTLGEPRVWWLKLSLKPHAILLFTSLPLPTMYLFTLLGSYFLHLSWAALNPTALSNVWISHWKKRRKKTLCVVKIADGSPLTATMNINLKRTCIKYALRYIDSHFSFGHLFLLTNVDHIPRLRSLMIWVRN